MLARNPDFEDGFKTIGWSVALLLELQAQNLKTYAQDFIKGDFSALPDIKNRKDELEKKDRELWNKWRWKRADAIARPNV